jgi:hypothetical protein
MTKRKGCSMQSDSKNDMTKSTSTAAVSP